MEYSYDRTAARFDDLERPDLRMRYQVWLDGRWTAEQISDDGDYTKVASGKLRAGTWKDMAGALREKARAKRLQPNPFPFSEEDWTVRGSGTGAYMVCVVG